MNQVPRSSDSFAPTASWRNLRLRAELLARLREAFERLEFLEVETPLLSRDTVVDRHLDPLVASGAADATPRYLQTSPEFGMKRLLAAAASSDEEHAPVAIYQIGKAFRDNESGALHNTEFTMVEWYRIGDDLATGIDLLDTLQQTILQSGAADRITYREAFLQHVGCDPLTIETESLPAIAMANGVVAPAFMGDDRDPWLDLLLSETVMPRLGSERPVILYEYPASQAALAITRSTDPPVAERFELFFRGVELANGYHELRDPNVLRARNQIANEQRDADGKVRLPEQSQLLNAMEHGLPNCAGCALGFDRAAMLVAGAKTLQEVLTFPDDHA